MKGKNTKTGRQCMTFLLSGVLALGMGLPLSAAEVQAAESGGVKLHTPVVEWNECDTVYFGHYWQEDTNGDGVADQKDDKTPIRWRILSKEGNDAYVIANQVLDAKPYNEEGGTVTWETCTLRSWLNGEFYDSAFTSEEQGAILEQRLSNPDNERWETAGGNDTEDKVYLASLQDVENVEYGFQPKSSFNDQARLGTATEYASGQGVYVNGEGSWWWLRSPGDLTDYASYVNYFGDVNTYGYNVSYASGGLRPALHINLSSPSVQTAEKRETSLKSVSWDTVELGTYGGSPAVWRVLEVSGDTVFLLSDRILEKKEYNEGVTEITWKDSTLRAWLNGEFLNDTFTEAEKAGILSWTYENADHAWYGTEGGEDTQDKVTLLSLDDIVKRDYGFPTYYDCNHPGRIACGEEGLNEYGYGSWWWLRSPGLSTYYASYVDGYGDVCTYRYDVYDVSGGVRPALHFSLSSLSSLTYAGTVTACEDGTVTYQEPEETVITGYVPREEDATTEEPTTEAPKTEDPASEAPTTEAAKTEAPTTEAAKTEAPNTEVPASEAAKTEVPTTETPKTGAPATEALKTETPKTEAPTTETPNTEASNTEASNTAVSTTEASKTEALTTETPNTEAAKTEIPATEAQESTQSPKNSPTKLNLANKKTCKLSKKVTIQDADGLKSVKLNGKSVTLKRGNKKLTFKLSKYKKYLKKKGKWNKLVIVDLKGKKKSIQFKTK